jgi:hypothetical protein
LELWRLLSMGYKTDAADLNLHPTGGIEPTTRSLQVTCSTN